MRFWNLLHISKYLGSIDCSCWCSPASHINSGPSPHLYNPYFVDADSKGSGESSHLQGLSEPSFLDTAVSTSTKSNVLAHLIYSLLLVIIYLAWFEISKELKGCNFITMFMFPCGTLSTKFNIKQNYTVKLCLIDRNNSNKKSQWTVEVLSFRHVHITILTIQGIFSKP